MKVAQIIVVALCLLFPASLLAGMYKCVEPNGSVIFTDSPKTSTCKPMSLGREIKVHLLSGEVYRVSPRTGQGKAKKTRSIDQYINLYGVRYDIDPRLIKAIIKAESAFNSKAVSKKGAKGLMQLMPNTAKKYNVKDPFDPKENIEAGTRYFRELLTSFKENLILALAAYNAGPTVVRRIGGIPNYPETQRYVKRVLHYFAEYKRG